jgi:hypothetical protein
MSEQRTVNNLFQNEQVFKDVDALLKIDERARCFVCLTCEAVFSFGDSVESAVRALSSARTHVETAHEVKKGVETQTRAYGEIDVDADIEVTDVADSKKYACRRCGFWTWSLMPVRKHLLSETKCERKTEKSTAHREAEFLEEQERVVEIDNVVRVGMSAEQQQRRVAELQFLSVMPAHVNVATSEAVTVDIEVKHRTCGRIFTDLREAVFHECDAETLNVDERTLLTGYVAASRAARERERKDYRNALLDMSSRLTKMREAVDDGFALLAELKEMSDSIERVVREQDRDFDAQLEKVKK